MGKRLKVVVLVLVLVLLGRNTLFRFDDDEDSDGDASDDLGRSLPNLSGSCMWKPDISELEAAASTRRW
jgi:hypothetical protein